MCSIVMWNVHQQQFKLWHHLGNYRREEIQCCIEKAAAFIEKIQASDGSWYALPIWEFSTDIVYNGKVCFLGYSHISYLVYTLFSSFLLLFLHGFEINIMH